MFTKKIKFKLNKKEGLVLLELLSKIDTSSFDKAENLVLSNLESLLEKEIDETFLENYKDILEKYKKDILEKYND